MQINDVTFRFLDAYKKLISDKKISDAKEFASEIGISSSMMTELLHGRSNIGIKPIQNIVLKFGVDAEWLITGNETPLNEVHEKEQHTDRNALEMIKELSAENALLKREVADLKSQKESETFAGISMVPKL
jgi:transcriptional regulator with XRE-family HTH domain